MLIKVGEEQQTPDAGIQSSETARHGRQQSGPFCSRTASPRQHPITTLETFCMGGERGLRSPPSACSPLIGGCPGLDPPADPMCDPTLGGAEKLGVSFKQSS